MGPKKNVIHQSPEEKLASSSQNSVDVLRDHSEKLDKVNKNIEDLHETTKDTSSILEVVKNQKETNNKLDELKDYVDHPEMVVKKLEEVKSASLITNKLLKDLNNKDVSKEFPSSLNVSVKEIPQGKAVLPIVETILEALKGEKGERGESTIGKNGLDGKDGKDGKSGKNGTNGKDGKSGSDGKNGIDGKDGSPDTPDEVVTKVNSSTKKINPERIKGLDEIARQVNAYGSNPQGYREAGGGGNVIRFLSNGVVVSAYVTELNFSTNITPTYDGNGRITLTASGGGGTTYSETPTGTINGSNVTFTTAHTITTIMNFVINGQFIHPAEYSASGTTITFVTAPASSLSGTGFTIIYQ